MVRCLAIVALFFVLGGCNNKGNPAGTPSVTSSVYFGTLNDTVLAVIFSNAHLNYSGTQYRYTLNSDGTFKVDENVGMGWTLPAGEEGAYTVSGPNYTFTPTVGRRDSQNPPGTMAPTDSLRPAYSGVMSNDSLTIANFLNIENKNGQRNLGTLVLKKQ
jgi:hypothetical protein